MTAIASRTATVFVIDCSKSMGNLQTFTEGTGSNVVTSQITPLEIMIKIVKVKVAERIMRGLKTTPLAILLYATNKTKNILTQLAKEAELENYDKEDDPYRGIQELISFNYNLNIDIIKKLDNNVKSGTGLDASLGKDDVGDLLNAILTGVETLDQNVKVRNYPEREVILLTNGESKTDWNDLEPAAKDMAKKSISLKVIGMDFNHENEIPAEGKSEIKLHNEKRLRDMIEILKGNTNSIFSTAAEAMVSLTAPKLKETRPTITKTKLTIGDISNEPERSIAMHIDVTKAIMVAPMRSMKTMSLRNYEKTGKKPTQRSSTSTTNTQSSQQQQFHTSESQAFANASQSNHESQGASNVASTSKLPASQPSQSSQLPNNNNNNGTSDFSRDFYMGNLGSTLEEFLDRYGLVPKELIDKDDDLRTNGVQRETRYYYRKIAAAKELFLGQSIAQAAREQEEAEEAEENDGKKEVEDDKIPGAEITIDRGYYYGGTLVSLDEMPFGAEKLAGNETGMQIIAFLKKSEIHYEWRMGDLLDITASPGQTGSQLMLSAFINGMHERKSVALTRWVAKGTKVTVAEPKIGILWPALHIDGHEFCYWAQLPYSEDIRNLTFPSLTEIKLRKTIVTSDHKYLPTPAMNEAMSAFIDAMDISKEGEPDEEGNPTSWYSPEKSFSPAIHNLNNTLIHRLISSGPLPPVPEALTRYANPPIAVTERANEARLNLLRHFEIHKVPPKPKKIGKNKKNNYDGEIIEPDAIAASSAVEDLLAVPPSFTQKAPTGTDNQNSAMEVDEDDHGSQATTSTRDETPDPEDDDVVIIEPVIPKLVESSMRTSELEQFKTLSSMAPSTAISGMFKIVKGWVLKSFSTTDYPKSIEGIQMAAKVAEKYGEFEVFNDELQSIASLARKDAHKAFSRYLKEARITLLIGEETSKQDTIVFTQSL